MTKATQKEESSTMETYKISIIGDAGTGKSSFIKRLLDDQFPETYVATLGVEVYPYKPQDNSHVCFNLWDTAGQARYAGLGDGYYASSDACLVFVDIGDVRSLANLGEWVIKFREVCPEAPIIYVFNKSDSPVFNPPAIPESVTMSCKFDTNVDSVIEALYDALDIDHCDNTM